MSKQKASRVMGIDASTHSLAFAVFEDRKLVRYGKINFSGADSYHRLASSMDRMVGLYDNFDVDFIAIEKAVMVRSVSVAIKLGMSVGVIIACLMRDSTNVVEVPPITWQSFIGNTIFTKKEKAAFKRRNPGKSASWLRNEIRKERKRYTMNYFNKRFGISIDDDDVSDAIGVAWYAANELTQ